MTDQTLHLIDGSGFLFRAFHGLPRLTNADGEPTGALFGIVNMIKRLQLEHKPTLAAFVFDASGPTFREEIYPEYKAHRPPMPDELRLQVEPLLNLVQALGFRLLRIPGVEADDVIATLCKQATAAGLRVLISTGDKDLTQLVNERVSWTNTMTNETLDADGVMRKHGVRPDQIVDYLALMGDSVDNIPGVEKCGPKTAAKWLADYQTLENLVAHVGEIGGKIGENLRNAIPQLPMCKQLTQVKYDVELPLTVHDLTLSAPDLPTLEVMYKRYGFNQALRELKGIAATPAPSVKAPADVAKNYQLITEQSAFDGMLKALSAATEFAFDVETTSLNALEAELVGISFCHAPGQAFYVPVGHVGKGQKASKKDLFAVETPAPPQLPLSSVLQALKPLLENPSIGKIGHHGKYDLHVMARYGIQVQSYRDDSMLASYIFNSNATLHNMDAVAKKYLNYSTVKYEDVCGKGAKQISFAEVDLTAALAYAAEDADITLRLKQALLPGLALVPAMEAIYRELEMPLVPILQRMEAEGVLLDTAELKRQSALLGEGMEGLRKQAMEYAGGGEFSLDSPKQLRAVLFEQLKLPSKSKTASGEPSTDEDALDELRDEHPLPGIILAYRSLAKLKGTYTDKLPELCDAQGRVHTSFHQAVAATGRLSSSDPNLQNIPIRTPEGRRIRKAFIAKADHVILAADYSQIELRIMAHLSDDPGLLNAFATGVDVHRATAAEVFGAPVDQVSSEQRRAAKAINFGLIYGMSPFGLARNLGIARDLAKSYVERYFERYPGVKRYMESTRKQAHEQGYVETVFGRRLYLPDLAHKNYSIRQSAERQAINAPMQGTAADIIKRAMLALDPWLQGKRDELRMLLQVHDELLFEVRRDAIEGCTSEIRKRMSEAAALKVPLVVDVGVGESWDAAH